MKIGIAGCGTMGSSMAQIFSAHGHETILYNHRAETLEKARNLIDASWRDAIIYTADLSAIADADLIVENIAENIDIKKAFYRTLSEVVSDTTIIATNTSGLSINALSEAVKKPERFLGMHWFNPPHLVPLIEIIKNDNTLQSVADKIYEVALSIGKKPVLVNKDIPGFVANRLQLAIAREALALVNDGVVSAEGVDDVMKYSLGFRWACLGPLETMDFGGLDIFYHIAEYLMPDLCDSHEVPSLLEECFKSEAYGIKSGKGFYDYPGETGSAKKKERDENFLKIYNALYGGK